MDVGFRYIMMNRMADSFPRVVHVGNVGVYVAVARGDVGPTVPPRRREEIRQDTEIGY